MRDSEHYIGIDLGGTKIEIIALNNENQIISKNRVPTPKSGYNHILKTIVEQITDVELKIGNAASIGIGTPGSLDPQTGLVKNANTICLNHKPLQQDLQNLLNRKIIIANDADCFALSEALDGAGKGTQSLFAVIIGTGTGGGIAINGQLLTGPNQISGEWGHNPMPYATDEDFDNRLCYCGKRACIETFLSGPGLSLSYKLLSGQQLDPRNIVRAAEENDKVANQVLNNYAKQLARSTASVINILDPEMIVLGGGLSNLEYLYRAVPKLWPDTVFSRDVKTKLVPARFGDSSGVRGAAWLGKKLLVKSN